ncbi:YbgC/FadM family acyl-CoA thioesterase [Sulfurimonas sp. MAG313]|nr:YbgC/FadM family acyl-CoA thioesterase [Sulfurimonas sp. MAG313]MDF1880270.1 YbgC/FadM family acyl-CoA thioesterase [Sulfurimonas sp. MAG313]
MKTTKVYHCRIYYEDVDIGGYCYHSKYLNLCERARSEIFFEQGLSPVYKDYHFVVKSILADYINPGFFGDELEIHTSVLKQTNASLKLLQVVNNQRNETLFTMEVLLVCLKSSKVSKIPLELSEVFKT